MTAAAPQAGPWWRCRDRRIDAGARPLIMGVVNVTPDSFSDGGRYLDAGAAIRRGLDLARDGADILDVGGESSRPGADPVPEAEERRRVLPVIAELARATPALLSVDTTKATVAEAALAAGAHLVNDITALGGDPAMAGVARAAGAGVVLMHMQGTPRTMQANPAYGNVVAEVRDFLAARLAAAVAAGLDREQMAVDPGIGFGKDVEHNVRLLAALPRLAALGRPVLVGLSRKSFLGTITGAPAGERLAASLGGLAYAVLRGAHILRVHDAKESCEVVRLLAILRAAEDGCT